MTNHLVDSIIKLRDVSSAVTKNEKRIVKAFNNSTFIVTFIFLVNALDSFVNCVLYSLDKLEEEK